MPTAFLYHPNCLLHNTGPHHPERASRLEAILRRLKATKLIESLLVFEPEPQGSETEWIRAVHTGEYIDFIKAVSKKTFYNLDPDTVVSEGTFEAALSAVTCILKGVELIMENNAENGFCAIRPPGHHAFSDKGSGFCIFNNVTIAARYLQKKYNLSKILILDWDLHHGNGTQQIFYEYPSVLYISLHLYPYYPGTGSEDEIGEGKGRGFNLNIPMQAGSTDKEYLNVFDNIILPKIRTFRPEFILISAGFDGHKDDPLSGISLTEKGFYEMTKRVKGIAKELCNGRILSVLEGGYNLLSLASSVEAHLKGLMEGVG